MWMDGNDPDGNGVANTSEVNLTSWQDKSGQARHLDGVQSDPRFLPNSLNGLGVVDFDNIGNNANKDILWQTSTDNSLFYHAANYSMFAVSRYTGTDSERVISSADDWNWIFAGESQYYNRVAHFNGWVHALDNSVAINNTDWHLYEVTISDQDRANTWLDGSVMSVNNAGADSNNNRYRPKRIQFSGWKRASNGDQNNGQSQCQIAEFIFINRVIPETERVRIQGYLARKWGLMDTYFSASHPHYANDPYQPTVDLGGSDANVTFYWGDNNASTNAGNWDSDQQIAGTHGLGIVSHPLTGLTKGATYYYTTKVTNSGGSAWGEVQSFVPANTALNKNTVPGLALWLDATDLDGDGLGDSNANSTPLSSWADKSTGGITVSQSGSSNQPVYQTSVFGNKPGIRFDGSDDSFNIATVRTSTGGYHAFVLSQRLTSGSGDGGAYLLKESGWNIVASAGTGAYSPFVAESFADNGATLSNLKIGRDPSSGLKDFGGDIGEILVFNRKLSTDEEQQIEGYLAHKWGGSANLPTSHPYRYVAPVFDNAPQLTPGIGQYGYDQITRAGLIGEWLFDDNDTASAIADTSGMASPSNGAVVNGTFSTDTPRGSGHSINFFGSNGYATISTAGKETLFNGSDAMTIALWSKRMPAADWGALISKYGEASAGWQLRKDNTGKLVFQNWGLSSGSNPEIPTAENNMTSVQWRHITVVHGHGGNKLRIYLDGNLVDEQVRSGTLAASNGYDLVLGAKDNDSTAGTFSINSVSNAHLDDVRIYNRALGKHEIASMIITSNRIPAFVATPFSYSIPATRGPTSWSVAGDNLSSRGLDINASTGEISGTPNAAGDFNATITAANSEGSDTQTYLFSVQKGSRSLAWDQTLAGKTYGDANFTLAGSSASAGGITYSSSDESILEINGTNQTQITLEDGLIHYWNFDSDQNGTGNPVNAKIGGMNGTKGQDVVVVAGKFGNALKFQGSTVGNNKVDFGANSRSDFDGTFTLSMWVNRTNNAGTQRLICNKSSTAGSGFELYFGNNNDKKLTARSSSSTSRIANPAVPSWAADKFYHIVAIYDAEATFADRRFQLYTDAVWILGADLPRVLDGSSNLFLGRSGSGSASSVFKGMIDDFRIYDRVLSGPEVSTLYDSGSGDFVTARTGNLATIKKGGTVTLTAYAPGTDNMYGANPVAKTMTISKAPLTITGNDYTINVGNSLPALGYSSSGWVNGDTNSTGLSTQVTMETNATNGNSAGVFRVSPTAAASDKYVLTMVDGQLVITSKTPQSISWGQDFANTAINQVIDLNASASSDLPISYAISDPTKAELAVTLESNLAAWWKMDHNTSTTVTDSTGSGSSSYTGVLIGTDGTSNWTTGKYGNALSLDGTNDYLKTTGYKGITGTNRRTISFWFKTTVLGKSILEYGDGSANGKKIRFALAGNGKPFVDFQGNGITAGGRSLNDGNWHHLALVIPEGANVQQAKLYVNGLLAGVSGGLQRYWSFDEASGNTAQPSRGTLAGTLGSGASFATGKFGNAVQMDGTGNGKVNFGLKAADLGANMTASFWAKWTGNANPNNQKILHYKSAWNSSEGFHIWAHQANKLAIRGASQQSVQPTIGFNWTANSWNHFAVTYQGTTARAFVNGSSVGAGAVAALSSGTTNLQTGGNFTGLVDELRLYDRVLSNGEITDLYGSGNGDFNTFYQSANFAVNTAATSDLVIGRGTATGQSTTYHNGQLDDMRFYNAELNASMIERIYGEGSGDFNRLRVLASGDFSITASQDGDASFALAPQVTEQLNIGKLNQSIAFSPVTDKSIGDFDFDPGAQASSTLPVSYVSSAPLIASVEGTTPGSQTIKIRSAGSVTITASQAGDGAYKPSPDANQTFTVGYFNLFADSLPGLKLWLDGNSVDSDHASADTLTTGTAIGSWKDRSTATNHATQGTESNRPTYSAAALNGKGVLSFTAGQSSELSPDSSIKTIVTVLRQASSQSAETKPFGSNLSVTSSSDKFALKRQGSGMIDSGISSKSFAVLTLQMEAGNYALYLNGELRGSGTDPVLPSAFDKIGNDFAGDLAEVVAYDRVLHSSVREKIEGYLGHKWGLVSDFSSSHTYKVAKPLFGGTQVLSFQPVSDKQAGQTVTLNVTADSGLSAFTFDSNDSTVVSFSGNEATALKVGKVTITASQTGQSPWLSATASQPFIVTATPRVDQTITFVDIADKNVQSASFELNATASSGLPVRFAVISGTSATVESNGTVTIAGAGVTTIRASQDGNGSYNPAPTVEKTLTVTQVPQTITFNAINNVSLSAGTQPLEANASSGLSVSFASSDSSVAEVSGTTLTLKQGGTITITASQAGNGTFLAAPDTTRTLTILDDTQQAQTISWNQNLSGLTVVSSDTNMTAGASSNLTVSYQSSDTAVATVVNNTYLRMVGAGSTTISAIQQGNGQWQAAPTVEKTITLSKAGQRIVTDSNQTSLPNLTRDNGDFEFAPALKSVKAGNFNSTGLPLAYSTTHTNIIQITGGGTRLKPVGNGTATIYVNQAGSGVYNAATQKSFTVTVTELSPYSDSISGMLLWLDANDINADGLAESNADFVSNGAKSQASAWADRSGSANTLSQGTANLQPVRVVSGGKPGLAFGTGYGGNNGAYLSGAMPANLAGNPAFTLFVAVKTAGTSNDRFLHFGNSAGTAGQVLGMAKNGGYYFNGGGELSFPSVNFAGNIQIGAFRRTAGATYADGEFFLNGTGQIGSAQSGSSVPALPSSGSREILLGAGRAATGAIASQLGNGVVHEVMLFSGGLTDFAIRRMEGYLAHKWGSNARLVGGHPFKVNRPQFGGSQSISLNPTNIPTDSADGVPFMSIFDSAFELEGAYATSGLALSYESNNSSIISVTSAGLLQPTGQGPVRITVRQAGNSYFSAASPVVYNMKILGKRSQTVSFNTPNEVRIDEQLDLNATVSSGLDANFTIVSGGSIASLSGSRLTFFRHRIGHRSFRAGRKFDLRPG
jgi:hypothetical protein